MTLRKDAIVLSEEEDPRRSIVQVQVGNRTYDAHYSNNCTTCTHPARMYIETLIVQNYSYRSIADQYSETEYIEGGVKKKFPKVTWTAIRQHFKSGHSPLPTSALRNLVDDRSESIGNTYSGMVDKYLDPFATAQAVMVRGYDALATGTTVPSVKETLAAAKLLHELEQQSEASITDEAWREAMGVYFSVAREVMPTEMWEKFGHLLQTNPILQGIARRLNGEEEPQTIEGTTENVGHDSD